MTHGKITSAVSIKALEEETHGSITIDHFSPPQRAANALRMGAKSLIATGLCVFIPVAHFFLVPAGLVVTVILIILTYRRTSKITEFTGSCPACGAAIELSTTSGDKWPIYEYCAKCSREITLHIT